MAQKKDFNFALPITLVILAEGILFKRQIIEAIKCALIKIDSVTMVSHENWENIPNILFAGNELNQGLTSSRV